jgi:DNA-binding CsgD family transcriptional regulator
MERLGASSLRALVELIGVIGEFDDLDAFRAGISERVRGLIPCDVVAYNEVYPASAEAAGFIDPPGSLIADAPEVLGRYAHQHPLIGHHARNGVGDAVKLSDFVGRRALHRLDLYDHLFRPSRLEYQMAISVPGRPRQIVGMSLNRTRRDFTERDRGLLELLRPHLASVHRHLSQRERVERALTATEDSRSGRRGVILLDPDGQLTFASAGALRLLPDLGTGVLPRQLRDWIRADNSLELEVPTADGPMSARLVKRTHPHQHDAIVLEPTSAPARIAPAELDLTPRQAEILALVAQGLTNIQIGHALTLSPRTVEKHLERAYARIGATNRTDAAARIARRQNDPPRDRSRTANHPVR